MSKTLKAGSYCSIAQFIEATDPELHAIMRATCTLDAIDRAPRRTAGLTFLMLSANHPHREKLTKLIEETDPKKVTTSLQEAANTLQTMIIRDLIETPAKWKRMEPIPNFQFPSKAVVCKSVDGNKVVLEGDGGDCIITPHPSFRDGSRKGNLRVYVIESGVPSKTGKDAPIPTKNAAKPKAGAKRGGYQPTEEESGRLRFLLAIMKENQFANNLPAICQCIQNCAAGLVMFLKANYPDVFQKVLGVIQRDESDFYILVEPHLPAGSTPLVPDEIFIEWAKSAESCRDYEKYCAEICAAIEQYLPNHKETANAARASASSMIRAGFAKNYENAASANNLNGHKLFDNVDLASYYRDEPKMKLVHDLLHFCLPFQLHALSGLGKEDALRDFKEIIRWVGDLMHQKSTNIEQDEDLFRLFKNSSAFFYVPAKEEEMSSRKKATTSMLQAREKNFCLAPDYLSLKQHRRIFDSGKQEAFKELVEAAKSGLSAEQKKQILELISQ